jgi:chorismate lyase
MELRSVRGWSNTFMTSEPSDLKRLMLTGPDTVTQFLETLTGEVIHADVVRQHSMEAVVHNDLDVIAGHALTYRMTILKGRTTGVPYLCAESTYVSERLSVSEQNRLLRTSDPIGRVLAPWGMKMGREPLRESEHDREHALDPDVRGNSEVVWSRAYRLTIDGIAVFAIREWFLRSVLDALDRQVRS